MIPGITAGGATRFVGGVGGDGYTSVGNHRYWRVNITAVGTGTLAAMCQLEMYESEFGVNACGGGTASASSENAAAYTASKAFDGLLQDNGDTSSRTSVWASTNTALPHWIQYDFGMGNDVEIISIGVHGRNSTFASQMPTAFDVQYSDDGSSWTTHWSESGLSWAGYEFKKFVHPDWVEASYTGSPRGGFQYWRLFAKRDGGPNAPAVAELQFRATPGGADQATGGTASASSIFSGSFPASAAFDDDAGTLWSTSSAATFGWLQYQFSGTVEVAQIALTARNDTAVTTTPSALAVQYSATGSAPWTTLLNDESETGWSLGETRTYTDDGYI